MAENVEEMAIKAYDEFVRDGGKIEELMARMGVKGLGKSEQDYYMQCGGTADQASRYEQCIAEKMSSAIHSLTRIQGMQGKTEKCQNELRELAQQVAGSHDEDESVRKEKEDDFMRKLVSATVESEGEMSSLREAQCRLSEVRILTSEKLLTSDYDRNTCTLKDGAGRAVVMNTGVDSGSSHCNFTSSLDDACKRLGYWGLLKVALEQYATALPLFVGRPDEKAGALCGSVPPPSDYISNPLDKVAGKVRIGTEGGASEEEEDEEQWILAEVVSYDSRNRDYHVKDVFPEDKIRRRYVVGRRNVIPLPKTLANPETNPEALFPRETRVLALYPQTTCFYVGTVGISPQTADEWYTIIFDDKTYRSGFTPPMAVPQAFVIAQPL